MKAGWLVVLAILTGGAQANDQVIKHLCGALTKFSTDRSVADSAATPIGAFEDAVSRFDSQNLILRFLGGLESSQAQVRTTAEELLERARPALASHGVETAPITITEKISDASENPVGLQVTPNSEGSELNRFARDMQEQYGVRVVYSPDLLQKFGAGYHAASRTLFIPHDAVSSAKVDISMLHEKLHAEFHKRNEEGKDSLFLGHIVSITSEPVWKGTDYDRAISLEELATYPDSIHRKAEQFVRAASNQDKEGATQSLKGLRHSVMVSIQNSRNIDEWIGRALKEIAKNPEDISIDSKTVGTHQRVMGTFIIDGTGININIIMHHQMKTLLEPIFNARIAREIGPIKTQEDKERAFQIYHSMMRDLFTQRLVEIQKLNRSLLAQTEAIEKNLDVDSVEKVLEILVATRGLWENVETHMDWTPTVTP